MKHIKMKKQTAGTPLLMTKMIKTTPKEKTALNDAVHLRQKKIKK